MDKVKLIPSINVLLVAYKMIIMMVMMMPK